MTPAELKKITRLSEDLAKGRRGVIVTVAVVNHDNTMEWTNRWFNWDEMLGRNYGRALALATDNILIGPDPVLDAPLVPGDAGPK